MISNADPAGRTAQAVGFNSAGCGKCDTADCRDHRSCTILSHDRTREAFTCAAFPRRYVKQANRYVHRDDCGILRKVEKVLERYHACAEFIRVEISKDGTPLALEAVYT